MKVRLMVQLAKLQRNGIELLSNEQRCMSDPSVLEWEVDQLAVSKVNKKYKGKHRHASLLDCAICLRISWMQTRLFLQKVICSGQGGR